MTSHDISHDMIHAHISPSVVEVEDEFEAQDFAHEPILEPKDTYGLRPLPFRIGSAQFLEEENIGLEDLPSDSEDDMGMGAIYESDAEAVRRL